MMDIPKLRLLNQQLANPLFHSPKELVSWMGAVQAQDYAMAKWAVGMRLASATVRTVEEALQKGEILRTHVMVCFFVVLYCAVDGMWWRQKIFVGC